MEPGRGVRSWGAVGVSLFSCGLVLALLTLVGADLMWLVALGDHVRATGEIADGVPFASAPSEGWPPVLLVAELALSFVYEAGTGGLLIWHLCAVLAALVIIAIDARRRGASDLSTGLVLALVFVGGIAAFGVVRLQTFSFVPFALTLLLVRDQQRKPGRAMWCAPALVAIWGNLHGSVLIGVCVIGAYLLFSRLMVRRAETLALGVATLAALFVTPATWRTAEYYLGVLQNEAAAGGEGLWGPLRPSEPFDLMLLVGVIVLGLLAVRRRLPLWEYVALAGLVIGTIIAARNGIWLLLFLAAPAATSRAGAARNRVALTRPAIGAGLAGALALVAFVALLTYRAQAIDDEDDRLAAQVRSLAPGQVVLAPEPAVEALAVRRVRVWLGNPLDAFDPADQRAYLDFMAGRPGIEVAVSRSDAVLVQSGSPADVAMQRIPDFTVHDLTGSWVLYTRAAVGVEP